SIRGTDVINRVDVARVEAVFCRNLKALQGGFKDQRVRLFVTDNSRVCDAVQAISNSAAGEDFSDLSICVRNDAELILRTQSQEYLTRLGSYPAPVDRPTSKGHQLIVNCVVGKVQLLEQTQVVDLPESPVNSGMALKGIKFALGFALSFQQQIRQG